MALAPAAGAAELKVLAGGSMTASLKELGPGFETPERPQARHPLRRRARADQDGDVGAVRPRRRAGGSDEERGGAREIRAGPTADVAQIGFGVAVRAGAPKPDVSTPEALKATLKAQSVAFLPGELGRRLRAEGVRPARHRRRDEGQNKAADLARRRPRAWPRARPSLRHLPRRCADRRVELAGPFPGDLQLDFVLTAAVAARKASKRTPPRRSWHSSRPRKPPRCSRRRA